MAKIFLPVGGAVEFCGRVQDARHLDEFGLCLDLMNKAKAGICWPVRHVGIFWGNSIQRILTTVTTALGFGSTQANTANSNSTLRSMHLATSIHQSRNSEVRMLVKSTMKQYFV